jgi:rfaE bifunctional protein kinase chain/domain
MVVGDLVADRYILTEPVRLSREAPVMITRYQGEQLIPGGAANTVQNLLALGGTVFAVGVVGDDSRGRSLVDHLAERGIGTEGIVRDSDWVTITKTRVMVGDPNRMKQQVLRVDRDPPGVPSDRVQARLLETVRGHLSEMDAVLLSDYGYGAVTQIILDAVRTASLERVVTADSRYRILDFRGVDLASPNEAEVEEAVGFRIRTDDDLDRAGRLLRRRIEAPSLLVTRGNRGMSLFRGDGPRVDIPATGSREVTDVSGAGDTVIAVATLALAAGADVESAARLANAAAGVVVMKPGAATCSAEELTEALEGNP